MPATPLATLAIKTRGENFLKSRFRRRIASGTTTTELNMITGASAQQTVASSGVPLTEAHSGATAAKPAASTDDPSRVIQKAASRCRPSISSR